MPIEPGTNLANIPNMVAERIDHYNAPGGETVAYNVQYRCYIDVRTAGVANRGSLVKWIAAQEAAPAIWALLSAYGMHGRRSQLVPLPDLHAALFDMAHGTVDGIAEFSLPLNDAPSALHPAGGRSLADELTEIYNWFAASGTISTSGGYVVASKALHCLFPELVPMIDGQHTGLSYYNINRATYLPPLVETWDDWIGAELVGKANPSPRGDGRRRWGSQQLLAAIGINQRIYELWQRANGDPGLEAFLELDPTPGTTGIPRVIDKALW